MEDMQSVTDGTEALTALTRLFESNLDCNTTSLSHCASNPAEAARQQSRVNHGTRVTSTKASGFTATKSAKGKRRVYNYNDKSIWTEDELEDSPTCARTVEPLSEAVIVGPPGDRRQRPQYTIQYGFDVTSEDIFLGLGGKCNSMQHADHIKVVIELPLVKSKDEVKVDVTDRGVVELESIEYRLSLPLPNPVDENKGTAAWDPNLRQLTLRLPLVNLFPF